MVSVCRPLCASRQTIKKSQVYATDAGLCNFLYRTHDSEPFRAHRVNVLPSPNRLTLIQFSIVGMSSVHVGQLGDRALPM